VQQGNHRGRRGKRKFDLEFRQNEHGFRFATGLSRASDLSLSIFSLFCEGGCGQATSLMIIALCLGECVEPAPDNNVVVLDHDLERNLATHLPANAVSREHGGSKPQANRSHPEPIRWLVDELQC